MQTTYTFIAVLVLYIVMLIIWYLFFSPVWNEAPSQWSQELERLERAIDSLEREKASRDSTQKRLVSDTITIHNAHGRISK